jgi:hypothetical protein
MQIFKERMRTQASGSERIALPINPKSQGGYEICGIDAKDPVPQEQAELLKKGSRAAPEGKPQNVTAQYKKNRHGRAAIKQYARPRILEGMKANHHESRHPAQRFQFDGKPGFDGTPGVCSLLTFGSYR